MTDLGPSLLQAILAEPTDDAARLVYADWLEEQGEGKRSEFIRCQIKLHEALPRLPVVWIDEPPVWAEEIQDTTVLDDRPMPIRSAARVTGIVESGAQYPLLNGSIVEIAMRDPDSYRCREFVVMETLNQATVMGMVPVQVVSCVSSGVTTVWASKAAIDARKLLDVQEYAELKKQEFSLWVTSLRSWFDAPGLYFYRFEQVGEGHLNPLGGGSLFASVRRGFVDLIVCTIADWLRWGSACVRSQPLTEVRLTDRSPAIVEGGFFWYPWSLHEQYFGNSDRWHLPRQIWDHLQTGLTIGNQHNWYDSEAAALSDLSQACLAYARAEEPQWRSESRNPFRSRS